MSHGVERERELLRAAVAQISTGLCLWCRTTTYRVPESGRRAQLRIVHRPRCRATRTLADRRRADELVVALLQLHGVAISHYGEDDLVVHTKVMVL